MRGFFLILVFVLGAGGIARAQDQGISDTINNQVAAFRAGDAEAAFGYASQNIRAIFGTAARFDQMVARGYPMVRDPAEVRMLAPHQEADGLWQRVLFIDRQGQGHVLDYQMVQTPQGWRINAVVLVPQAGVGA